MISCDVLQRLASAVQSASGGGSSSSQFLGFFYFSGVAPLSSHGTPPGKVMFMEMHMQKSGKNTKRIHHISTVSTSPSINQPINQSINQSINHSINQSISQSINQPVDQ